MLHTVVIVISTVPRPYFSSRADEGAKLTVGPAETSGWISQGMSFGRSSGNLRDEFGDIGQTLDPLLQ